jgi:hypothetical protein
VFGQLILLFVSIFNSLIGGALDNPKANYFQSQWFGGWFFREADGEFKILNFWRHKWIW